MQFLPTNINGLNNIYGYFETGHPEDTEQSL
jgi:hypothetical protein